MSSASCSAAAWLLPPKQHGNFETVVIYDNPYPLECEDTLKIFIDDSKIPEDLLSPSAFNPHEIAPSHPEFAIRSLQWTSSNQLIKVSIQPAHPVAAKLMFKLSGVRHQLFSADDSNTVWMCRLNEGIGRTTIFTLVHISLEEKSWDACKK